MLFLLALLLSWQMPAAARADVKLPLQYFEDKFAKLTPEEVIAPGRQFAWQPLNLQKAGFGLTDSRFWFRFKVPEEIVKNGQKEPLFLEVSNAYLGRVQLFTVVGGKIFEKLETGLSVPVSQRSRNVLRNGFSIFRLTTPRDSQAEYYLSIEGPLPLSLPLNLWEAPEFALHNWLVNLITGIYVGCLLMAAAFNGFLAIFLRSRLYGAYSLFVFSMLWISLSSTGLSQQLLWPEWTWWCLREMHVIGGISLLFYAGFVRDFLSTPKVSPRLDRLLVFLVVVNLFRSVWMFFDLNGTVGMLGVMASAFSNFVVVAIAIKALKNGDRSARYFFYASAIFNLAMILFLLQQVNVIWVGPFMAWMPFLGTFMEVILLGLALADRIRTANQELAEQKATIVHAEKIGALGRMAGEIAHEISNPLAIIHGNSVLIRQQLEGKGGNVLDIANTARTIEATAERISKLVKGMRSLARDSRKDPFQQTSVDSVIQDALAICEDRISQSGVRFEPPTIPEGLTLRCRSSEICQVLVNLLSNAFDAVEGKSGQWVKLEVSLKLGMAQFAVTDSGQGVPREFRLKIQEPFFTTKEVGKGLGLGLSISRTIVEQHGGQLWLDESSVNTRFVFSVPVWK